MLTRKPTTPLAFLLTLDRWNRAITAATNRRDKAALRAMAEMFGIAAETMTGTERDRTAALAARAEDALRYLKTWRGWRRLRLCRVWRAFP